MVEQFYRQLIRKQRLQIIKDNLNEFVNSLKQVNNTMKKELFVGEDAKKLELNPDFIKDISK